MSDTYDLGEKGCKCFCSLLVVVIWVQCSFRKKISGQIVKPGEAGKSKGIHVSWQEFFPISFYSSLQVYYYYCLLQFW